MKKIPNAKYNQSAKFRATLQNTMACHLVHNVENDGFWGCGVDGQGTNILGILLEEVRRTPQQVSTSYTAPSTDQVHYPAPNTTQTQQTAHSPTQTQIPPPTQARDAAPRPPSHASLECSSLPLD